MGKVQWFNDAPLQMSFCTIVKFFIFLYIVTLILNVFFPAPHADPTQENQVVFGAGHDEVAHVSGPGAGPSGERDQTPAPARGTRPSPTAQGRHATSQGQRYVYSTPFMLCLHYPRPRPIERRIKCGLYTVVWRCSYCAETDDNTDSNWVLCTCSRYLSRSRSLAVWMDHNTWKRITSYQWSFFVSFKGLFTHCERLLWSL